MGQLISAKQLADRLGISLRTLEDLIARDLVPPHIKLGRLRRWDSGQVERWLHDAFQKGGTNLKNEEVPSRGDKAVDGSMTLSVK